MLAIAKDLNYSYLKIIKLALVLGFLFFFIPLEIAGFLVIVFFSFFAPLGSLYFAIFLLPFLPNPFFMTLTVVVVGCILSKNYFTEEMSFAQIPLTPPLFIYSILVLVATLTSVTFEGSLRDFAIYTLSFMLFFALVSQVKNKQELYNLVIIFTVGLFLVSCHSIYQYIIDVPMESGWVDSSNSPELTTRVYSVFGNPNVLAKYLLSLFPISFALAMHAKDKLKKVFLFGTSACAVLAMIFTFSRSGWIGLLASLSFFTILKDKKLFTILLIVILVGTFIVPDIVSSRITSVEDTSSNYRLMVWQETTNIISDFWLTGVGLGYEAFREIYPFYMIDNNKSPYHAHNTYLQILVETGIIGLLVFIWLIIVTFKRGIKLIFTSKKDSFVQYIVLGSLSSIVGLLTQGLVENIFYMPKITALFYILVSFIFVAYRLNCRRVETYGQM